MANQHIQIKSRIGLPKCENPEILSVIVTRQDICYLAQFMKWTIMQEILKLLHRIAQFMNWALRVSCYCPFHELGNSAAQFMNWTISQIGRNICIYIYTYIYNTIHMYSGITSGRVLNGELLYTKILEVNLFAFAYRLFRRDFSPLDGTYCMGTYSFLQPYMHFLLIWEGFMNGQS